MKLIEVWLIIILMSANFLCAIYMLSNGRSTLYSRIWEFENVNFAGKLLLCIFTTPFSIFATLFIWLCILCIFISCHIFFGIRLLFAEDKSKARQEFYQWMYGYCESCDNMASDNFEVCQCCKRGNNFKTK